MKLRIIAESANDFLKEFDINIAKNNLHAWLTKEKAGLDTVMATMVSSGRTNVKEYRFFKKLLELGDVDKFEHLRIDKLGDLEKLTQQYKADTFEDVDEKEDTTETKVEYDTTEVKEPTPTGDWRYSFKALNPDWAYQKGRNKILGEWTQKNPENVLYTVQLRTLDENDYRATVLIVVFKGTNMVHRKRIDKPKGPEVKKILSGILSRDLDEW